MAGRLQFQHRMGLDRVEGGEVVGDVFALFRRHLAAKAAVAQDGVDSGIGKGAGQVVILPKHQ
ncbi:hypothetical protein GALL_366630 [mine drainage metagenome]|uniref:Uncharacterized protein n=1 Tax=mine drainage metagenome TaxID=410659 RepID=A0A1J5QVR3_9ZZZZ